MLAFRCIEELGILSAMRILDVGCGSGRSTRFLSGLSCRVDHPENKPPLHSGQAIKVTLLAEEITLKDYFWSDEDYLRFFLQSGFNISSTHYPLGRRADPLPWFDEITTAPYVIDFLAKSIN